MGTLYERRNDMFWIKILPKIGTTRCSGARLYSSDDTYDYISYN